MHTTRFRGIIEVVKYYEHSRFRKQLDVCVYKYLCSWTLLLKIRDIMPRVYIQQQYFSYIMAVSFNGGGNGVPGENHDLPQVIDKLYHITLYTSPWAEFELTSSVVIGTDFKGSCNSNYITIITTTATTMIF
jgi:hypothetical protein